MSKLGLYIERICNILLLGVIYIYINVYCLLYISLLCSISRYALGGMITGKRNIASLLRHVLCVFLV